MRWLSGRRVFYPALTALMSLAFPQHARAQALKAACSGPSAGVFLCAETLFSEPPLHLTFSSLPPPNGLPVGIVFEKDTHYLASPFRTPPDPQPSVSTTGPKGLTDVRLALVGSTNASWYATGSLVWLPPLAYSRDTGNGDECQRLGPFCAKAVMAINLYVSHRSLKTLYFYGIGPSAPATRYMFQETETYGGANARLPIRNWLRIEGQVENRRPSLPASSDAFAVVNNFTNTTAPGISSPPDFMHYSATVQMDEKLIAEEPFPKESPTTQSDDQFVMKPRVVYHFQNNVGYHWYTDLDTGRYSFQQFAFDGSESVQLGSVMGVGPSAKTPALGIGKLFCPKPEDRAVCDFGTLELKSLVLASRTAGSNVVPFFYQPTLGGSDIESRQTLRGLDDYRFRGPDLALLQVEYSRTVRDPLGGMIFYDGGAVGSIFGDLSIGHFKHDVGVGLTISLQKRLVFDAFVATGGGRGVRLGYNFNKFF
jgi:hypothetical protein